MESVYHPSALKTLTLQLLNCLVLFSKPMSCFGDSRTHTLMFPARSSHNILRLLDKPWDSFTGFEVILRMLSFRTA